VKSYLILLQSESSRSEVKERGKRRKRRGRKKKNEEWFQFSNFARTATFTLSSVCYR